MRGQVEFDLTATSICRTLPIPFHYRFRILERTGDVGGTIGVSTKQMKLTDAFDLTCIRSGCCATSIYVFIKLHLSAKVTKLSLNDKNPHVTWTLTTLLMWYLYS